MQSDALNKQILHDQFEKSEPHATDLINCLNKFDGEDVFKVTRNGQVFSVIRKLN